MGKDNVDKVFQKHYEDQKKREAEIDQRINNRTAKFDSDLKDKARTIGINPDNFESEDELQNAINKFEKDE